MKKYTLLLNIFRLSFASIYLAACSTSSSETPAVISRPHVFSESELCAGTTDPFDCAKKKEQALIKLYPELVSRNENVLKLKLRYSDLELVDEGIQSNYDRFAAIDFLADLNVFVVARPGSESIDLAIADGIYGLKSRIIGFPIASPGKTQFVCSKPMNNWSKYGDDLEVWVRENTRWYQSFEIEGLNWKIGTVKWKNDTEIHVWRAKTDADHTPPALILTSGYDGIWTKKLINN